MTQVELDALKLGDAIIFENSNTYEIIAFTLERNKLSLKLIWARNSLLRIGEVCDDYPYNWLLQDFWHVSKKCDSSIYDELDRLLAS